MLEPIEINEIIYPAPNFYHSEQSRTVLSPCPPLIPMSDLSSSNVEINDCKFCTAAYLHRQLRLCCSIHPASLAQELRDSQDVPATIDLSLSLYCNTFKTSMIVHSSPARPTCAYFIILMNRQNPSSTQPRAEKKGDPMRDKRN